MLKCVLILNKEHYFSPAIIQKLFSSNRCAVQAVIALPHFESHISIAKRLRYYLLSSALMGMRFTMLYSISELKRSFLVRTLPSHPSLKNVDLESCVKRNGIHFQELASVNEKDFISAINQFYDVPIVNACSQIYTSETLSQLPEIYNIHPSLLPKHRGAFPMFWAILKNSQFGISCHTIAPKIDSGQILYRKELPRPRKASVLRWMKKYIEALPEFIIESLYVINEEKPTEIPFQNEPYEPYPSLKDILRYFRT